MIFVITVPYIHNLSNCEIKAKKKKTSQASKAVEPITFATPAHPQGPTHIF